MTQPGIEPWSHRPLANTNNFKQFTKLVKAYIEAKVWYCNMGNPSVYRNFNI